MKKKKNQSQRIVVVHKLIITDPCIDSNQRGCKSDTVASLMDGSRAATATATMGLWPSRSMILPRRSAAVAGTARPAAGSAYAGASGAGSVMERLLSMTTTDAMLGRRCGSSWTQSSPTRTHRRTSLRPSWPVGREPLEQLRQAPAAPVPPNLPVPAVSGQKSRISSPIHFRFAIASSEFLVVH